MKRFFMNISRVFFPAVIFFIVMSIVRNDVLAQDVMFPGLVKNLEHCKITMSRENRRIDWGVKTFTEFFRDLILSPRSGDDRVSMSEIKTFKYACHFAHNENYICNFDPGAPIENGEPYSNCYFRTQISDSLEEDFTEARDNYSSKETRAYIVKLLRDHGFDSSDFIIPETWKDLQFYFSSWVLIYSQNRECRASFNSEIRKHILKCQPVH